MIGAMLGKGLMRLVLVVQALAAIAIGLLVLNVDLLATLTTKAASLVKPLEVVVGLCGVAGLIEAIMGCCGGCHKS